MKETTEIKIQSIQHAVKDLMVKLNDASLKANAANKDVIQLSWDLGDNLQKAKQESPDNFEAFLDGLNINKDVAKCWLKVRSCAETKEDLESTNSVRQAMLAMLVPSKEGGEERIELAPPQTFYQWVNKSNSWLKKLEVGLVKYQPDALKNATLNLYSFLKEIHEK